MHLILALSQHCRLFKSKTGTQPFLYCCSSLNGTDCNIEFNVQELTVQLEEKQDVFRSLQDTAELLSLENHPAKQTVEVCD